MGLQNTVEQQFKTIPFDVDSLKKVARMSGLKGKDKLYVYMKHYLGLNREIYTSREHNDRVSAIVEAIKY